MAIAISKKHLEAAKARMAERQQQQPTLDTLEEKNPQIAAMVGAAAVQQQAVEGGMATTVAAVKEKIGQLQTIESLQDNNSQAIDTVNSFLAKPEIAQLQAQQDHYKYMVEIQERYGRQLERIEVGLQKGMIDPAEYERLTQVRAGWVSNEVDLAMWGTAENPGDGLIDAAEYEKIMAAQDSFGGAIGFHEKNGTKVDVSGGLSPETQMLVDDVNNLQMDRKVKIDGLKEKQVTNGNVNYYVAKGNEDFYNFEENFEKLTPATQELLAVETFGVGGGTPQDFYDAVANLKEGLMDCKNAETLDDLSPETKELLMMGTMAEGLTFTTVEDAARYLADNLLDASNMVYTAARMKDGYDANNLSTDTYNEVNPNLSIPF
jgi:hypothetical protein